MMATSGCSPVKFVGTCGNALYFQVATATDVDHDAFRISQQSLKNYWVRSKDNKFLLLNPESHFQVQNLTSHQLSEPDCKFKIQIYHEIPGGRGLKGAMLYVKVQEKNMVVCCSQNHGIGAEEMDIPSHIEETKHKALFFMTASTASNTYLFESSMYHSEFLGFEPDEDKPYLHKLVLHPKGSLGNFAVVEDRSSIEMCFLYLKLNQTLCPYLNHGGGAIILTGGRPFSTGNTPRYNTGLGAIKPFCQDLL